jgi:hypothetical protein
LLSVILYSAGWYFLAQEIEKATDDFYHTEAPPLGLTMAGDEPEVTGFPLAPAILYREGIASGSYAARFPLLRLEGFPFPGLPYSASFPQGIEFGDVTDENPLIELNHFSLDIVVPPSFPESSGENHIRHWQQNVGTIEISDYHIISGIVEIQGNGTVGLDQNLQPTANLAARVRNHEDIVQYYVETEQIKPLAAALALSALRALEQSDPATGETYVEAPLVIQDNELYIGPVKLADLPPVEWARAD